MTEKKAAVHQCVLAAVYVSN